MTKTIKYGNEYMLLHDDGCISRPAIGMPPSGQWKVVGAVRYNNFGKPVEQFTLADILGHQLQWTHKNGHQRIHIKDFDHGAYCVWMRPVHQVY